MPAHRLDQIVAEPPVLQDQRAELRVQRIGERQHALDGRRSALELAGPGEDRRAAEVVRQPGQEPCAVVEGDLAQDALRERRARERVLPELTTLARVARAL